VAPTAGDITVFGHSIQSDPQTIRRWVGVCKQDDYLWPNLSAKDHLDLFAGLRGVPPLDHDAMVQKWLESVDLDGVQHQYSSQFSGGMKRRLSLAMSTIGARSLIVLDEPTTGTHRGCAFLSNVRWFDLFVSHFCLDLNRNGSCE
jgi:ABC-type multidrug transport system ATPase subunit